MSVHTYTMRQELLKLAGALALEAGNTCPRCRSALAKLDLENKQCSQCKWDLTKGKEYVDQDEEEDPEEAESIGATKVSSSSEGLREILKEILRKTPSTPEYRALTATKGVLALGAGIGAYRSFPKTAGLRLGNPVLRLRRKTGGIPSETIGGFLKTLTHHRK